MFAGAVAVVLILYSSIWFILGSQKFISFHSTRRSDQECGAAKCKKKRQ